MEKVNEWLSGIPTIKIFSISKKIQEKPDDSVREVKEASFAMRKMTYLSKTVSTFMSYASHVVILIMGVIFVVKKHFTVGQFFITINLIDQLSYPIISLSVFLQEITSVKPLVQELIEEMAVSESKETKPFTLHDPLTGIDFHWLTFL